MAKKVTETIVCDMTGDPAAESIDFTVEGVGYHLDLSDVKAKEFHEVLLPFVTAAKVTKKARTTGGGTKTKSDASLIREWARSQGKTVPERGRIPADLRAEYEAAQATAPAETVAPAETAPDAQVQ